MRREFSVFAYKSLVFGCAKCDNILFRTLDDIREHAQKYHLFSIRVSFDNYLHVGKDWDVHPEKEEVYTRSLVEAYTQFYRYQCTSCLETFNNLFEIKFHSLECSIPTYECFTCCDRFNELILAEKHTCSSRIPLTKPPIFYEFHFFDIIVL